MEIGRIAAISLPMTVGFILLVLADTVIPAFIPSLTVVHATGAAGVNGDCPVKEGKASLNAARKVDWGRDPFQYPDDKTITTSAKTTANGARLVAIISGKRGTFAIFGHSIVQKGDLIGNERVLDITANRVTMIHGGCKRTIALHELR